MANKNFIVKNGLTVGTHSIVDTNANITANSITVETISFADGGGAGNSGFSVASLTVGQSPDQYIFPIGDGNAGEVLSTDGEGNLSFTDLNAVNKAGYVLGTLNEFPSDTDLAVGGGITEAYLGESDTEAVDAFGISLLSVFDLMDPVGRLEEQELMEDEQFIGA